MIQIKYTQPGNRVVGNYTWTEREPVQVVSDIELVAELLTYPKPQFEAAGGKPTKKELKALAELLNISEGEASVMLGQTETEEVEADG